MVGVIVRRRHLSSNLLELHVVSTAAQIGLPNLDTGRFRRPGEIRPVSVPARFRQVSSPGVASQANKAGTLPLPASESPTTFTCMLTCRPSLSRISGVALPGRSPAQGMPGQGACAHSVPPPAPPRRRGQEGEPLGLLYTRSILAHLG